MTLIKFNHPGLVNNLAKRAFNESLADSNLGNHYDCQSYSKVKYNISDNDTFVLLELAVPGLSKDDLSIELENSYLKIKTVEKGGNENHKGFFTVNFEKQFKLSDKINVNKISAKTENGILSVTLPKVEAAIKKPARSIEIV